jgi:hypothetical protein
MALSHLRADHFRHVDLNFSFYAVNLHIHQHIAVA